MFVLLYTLGVYSILVKVWAAGSSETSMTTDFTLQERAVAFVSAVRTTVHILYRVHESAPLAAATCISSQSIHFNIILVLTPVLPERFLPVRYSG